MKYFNLILLAAVISGLNSVGLTPDGGSGNGRQFTPLTLRGGSGNGYAPILVTKNHSLLLK